MAQWLRDMVKKKKLLQKTKQQRKPFAIINETTRYRSWLPFRSPSYTLTYICTYDVDAL